MPGHPFENRDWLALLSRALFTAAKDFHFLKTDVGFKEEPGEGTTV